MTLVNRHVIIYQNATKSEFDAIRGFINQQDACELVAMHHGPDDGLSGVVCVECQQTVGELTATLAELLGSTGSVKLVIILLGGEYQSFGPQEETAYLCRWLWNAGKRLKESPARNPAE